MEFILVPRGVKIIEMIFTSSWNMETLKEVNFYLIYNFDIIQLSNNNKTIQQ